MAPASICEHWPGHLLNDGTRRKLPCVTQWTSFEEPDPADIPAWVRSLRIVLVFVYPAVSIGAAVFLVWATLSFNSYLINLPAWQIVFLSLLVAAVVKALVFVMTGNWLVSRNDYKVRRVVLSASWLGGPGVSLLMLVLSSLLGEGLGSDVLIIAIPEACVAATISIAMLPSRRV